MKLLQKMPRGLNKAKYLAETEFNNGAIKPEVSTYEGNLYHEKVHKKQLYFHKCKKRNRWVFGGNRSGKTECGAVETVWLARGIHPFKENKKDISCWVVSLTRQVQRDVGAGSRQGNLLQQPAGHQRGSRTHQRLRWRDYIRNPQAQQRLWPCFAPHSC